MLIYFIANGNNIELLMGIASDNYILYATINREDLTIRYFNEKTSHKCKLITRDDYLRTKESWLLSIDEYQKKEKAKRKF